MESNSYGYTIGLLGFLYGSVGYGLSVFTYIFGAALHRFFPKRSALPIPIPSRGRPSPAAGPGGTRGSPRKPSSKSSAHKLDEKRSLQLALDTRLRRVSSLDSLARPHSLILVAPAITLNCPDDVGNPTRDTITIHPSSQIIDKTIPPLRGLTLDHPTPLSILPPPGLPLATESSRPVFRLSGLKPKILRSVSSPQLTEFTDEKLSFSAELKKGGKDDPRVQFSLSAKASRRSLRQEKSDAAISQSPSKFFSSFPKNGGRKRQQPLRTQPYDAPYFMPPPVPPIPLELVLTKEAKRSKTMPADKSRRPSAPQK